MSDQPVEDLERSTSGAKFRPIPIRPWIAEQRWLDGYSDKLKMEWVPRAPEEVTEIHTAFRNRGIDVDVLMQHERNEERVRRVQKRITNTYARTNSFISNDNDIPGFRKLIFAGDKLFPNAKNFSVKGAEPELRFALGVTDKGQVFSAVMGRLEGVPPTRSLAEDMEVFMNGREGHFVMPVSALLNLSKHGATAIGTAATHIMDVMDSLAPSLYEKDPKARSVAIQSLLEGKWRSSENGRFKRNLFDGVQDANMYSPALEEFKKREMLSQQVLTATMRSGFVRKLQSIRWHITKSMNPDDLHIMRSTLCTYLDHAAWLTGFNPGNLEIPSVFEDQANLPEDILGKGLDLTHCFDEVCARNRYQASNLYPMMMFEFFAKRRIFNVIDEGKPLNPALASHLDVPEENLWRAKNLKWQRTGQGPQQATIVLKELCSLPQKIRVDNRADFKGIQTLKSFSSIVYNNASGDWITRMAPDGDIQNALSRIEGIHPRNILDAIKYIADKLYAPAKLEKIRRTCEDLDLQWTSRQQTRRIDVFAKQSQKDLINSLKLKDLIEISHRYHRNIRRLKAKIHTVEIGKTWEAMIGDFPTETGLLCREVTSSARLDWVGENQDHCVGGYVDDVMNCSSYRYRRGMTLIFTTEKPGMDPEEAIQSTVEMDVYVKEKWINCQEEERENDAEDGAPKKRIEVVRAKCEQNWAYGNSSPSEDARKAVKELKKHFKDLPVSAFRTYVSKIEEREAWYRGQKETNAILSKVGYNPWSATERAAAWEELQHYLPRSIRKKGLEAFIEGQDISAENLEAADTDRRAHLWEGLVDDGPEAIKAEDPFVSADLSAEICEKDVAFG